jgi:hypothetical protein
MSVISGDGQKMRAAADQIPALHCEHNLLEFHPNPGSNPAYLILCYKKNILRKTITLFVRVL